VIPPPTKETFAARWQKLVSVFLGFAHHLRLMYLLMLLGLAAGLLYYVYTRSVYYTRALVKVHTLGLPIKSVEEYDIRMRFFGRMFLHRSVQEHTATMMGLSKGFTSYETLSDKYLQKLRMRDFDSGSMVLETWAYYPSIANAWPRLIVDGYNDYVRQVREGRRTLLNTVFKEEVSNLKKLSEQQASSALNFSESHNAVEMFIEKRELDKIPADLLRIREHIKIRATVEKTLANNALNVEERLSVLSRFEEEYPAIGSMLDDAPAMAPPALVGRPSSVPSAPSGTGLARSTVVVVPSLVGKTDDWNNLLGQQRQLIAKRNDLSSKFLGGHPQMVALDHELESLNARLQGELSVLQNRFSLETERLRAQEKELESQLPEFARFQKEFDSFERERDLLMAGQLPAHEGAMELQKKIGEAAYTMNQDRFSVEYLTTVESRLVDPMSPSKKQGLIASLAVGFCLAIGVPLLLERVRSWSSRVDELEEVTGLPALGVVTNDLSLQEVRVDPNYTGECFRIMRSGILFSADGKRDTKVILVTSSRPREGKTTIAMRLAIAMTQAGSRVVLVDGDMRRGRIHRSFDMERSPGLSDYLTGQKKAASVDDILHAPHPTLPGFFVITTGETRNDAPEIIESPRAQALIEELKNRFDHVIIDSPPVLGLADCYPLLRLSDGVAFVVRANFTTYSEASASVQALAAGGARFFGFVLNRVDLTSPDNVYYYYRYQPKYYSAHLYGQNKARN
jgi:capsular exopolysaccharide synthesis family protein